MTIPSEVIPAFAFCTTIQAVGAPRLWVAVALVAVFPPSVAFVLSLSSALLGSELAFLVIRYLKRGRFVKKIENIKEARLLTEKLGVFPTVLARQLPLPGAVVNAALALSGIGNAKFIIGSLIGFLPSTILVCSIGDFAKNPRAGTYKLISSLTLSIISLSIIILMRLYNKRRKIT